MFHEGKIPRLLATESDWESNKKDTENNQRKNLSSKIKPKSFIGQLKEITYQKRDACDFLGKEITWLGGTGGVMTCPLYNSEVDF